MNNFAQALKVETSKTITDNGRMALGTTGENLLDFFSTIGAIRNADLDHKTKLVDLAMSDDKLLATKTMFYGRDIRGGLGERKTFQELLNYVAKKYPETLEQNIPLVSEYGRFDDLYAFIGTPLEANMWNYMRMQFKEDLENMKNHESVSLLAKWIKTPDASSKNTRKLGILTSQKLGYKNVALFKKDLKALRRYIDITEIKVSSNRVSEIDFEKVPSLAMLKYRNKFMLDDNARFTQYLEDVSSGKAKINTSTLYPYDIAHKVIFDYKNNEDNAVLEAQWNNLPDYLDGDDTNILIMADVSGSMTCCKGLPMASSVGLALYFAERNKGAFHNKFMTFSARPELVEVSGATLSDKIRNIESADWGMNTNLDLAFKTILDTAVKNNTPAEELPKALVIISDMQIDYCADMSNTFYDTWKDNFAKAGYEIPNIVFWNVNSERNTFHASADQKGVMLLSGHSASTFKTLIDNLDKTPVEVMLNVLNSDRYKPIIV